MEIYSQARHLDIAISKYGLFVLIINVNAMTGKEEGRRGQENQQDSNSGRPWSKSFFLKWIAYVTGD